MLRARGPLIRWRRKSGCPKQTPSSVKVALAVSGLVITSHCSLVSALLASGSSSCCPERYNALL